MNAAALIFPIYKRQKKITEGAGDAEREMSDRSTE